MTSSKTPTFNASLTRRRLLQGAAQISAGIAMVPFMGVLSAVASPGSNVGKYKLDLGGYIGPELTEDTVQLRFMHQDYPPAVNDFLGTLYKKFSAAYPNITIAEERVPYGDLPTKAQVYISSGDAPDLMMGRSDFAAAYGAGEIAAPLQTFFSPDFQADMSAPLRESATIGGNLVCMPWETNPVLMYFNRDIFKKHGVQTPPEVTDVKDGWTIEQFEAALAELTQKIRAAGDTQTYALASSTYGNGGPGSNYTQMESMWIRMMGDNKADRSSSAYKTFQGVSDDGLSVTGYIDTPEAIAGMKRYQSFFQKGFAPTGNVSNQFLGGAAAIDFGSMIVTSYLRSHPDAFNWGASPVPHGSIYYTSSVSDAPFVWSGSSHQNEAAAFLAFMCNDENRMEFHKLWGSMPVRASLIAAAPLYQSEQPNKLAVSTAAASFGPPKTVGWFDYFNAINPAVKDIALGADPEKRMHEAALQIDGLLSKYK
ncbi:extracellular solute-binding protein [Rhizobium sp. S152]|uniref:extracellular solute-binding protein n=1 Tax=Rhizobium sp. S152 TaxID=3055038 RepID=UPI0025A9A94F|nr:extracellular solute-binding protein [Rhizobium sp. S152]MDM9624683.1 extracellular solute-binding protein [Rhizobium sp. S152]